MKRNDLAKELAVSERLPLSTAMKAVDGIVRILKETLGKGETITLRGFATLAVIQRDERNAVHFKTKEPILIPAHRTVKLKVSNQLKKHLNS